MSSFDGPVFRTLQLAVGGYDNNFSYLVISDAGTAALVDPCGDAAILRRACEENRVKPQYILITHAHPDHVSAVNLARTTFFPAPVCSKNGPDLVLKEGMTLPLGSGFIRILETPGHSDDSLVYQLSDRSVLLTGDTLFIDYIGFCHPKRMFSSLAKLKRLPPELMICSGHDYGRAPAETLGAQLEANPYLRAQTYEEFHAAWRHLE